MLRVYSIIFFLTYSSSLLAAEEFYKYDPIIIPLKEDVTIKKHHRIKFDFDHEKDSPFLYHNNKAVLDFSRLSHIAPFYSECSAITIGGVASYNNKIITAMVMKLKSSQGIFVDLIDYNTDIFGRNTLGNGSRFIWIVADEDIDLASIAIDEEKNQLCCIGTCESENVERHTDWLDMIAPSYCHSDEESALQSMMMLTEPPHSNNRIDR